MPIDEGRLAEEFAAAVNMDADELERWLETPESLSVGQKKQPGGESIGHASGRRIVAILRRGRPDEADRAHMRKVIGFIRRHRAQQPAHPFTSRWRYSLMNWGHDPLKSLGWTAID